VPASATTGSFILSTWNRIEFICWRLGTGGRFIAVCSAIHHKPLTMHQRAGCSGRRVACGLVVAAIGDCGLMLKFYVRHGSLAARTEIISLTTSDGPLTVV